MKGVELRGLLGESGIEGAGDCVRREVRYLPQRADHVWETGRLERGGRVDGLVEQVSGWIGMLNSVPVSAPLGLPAHTQPGRGSA